MPPNSQPMTAARCALILSVAHEMRDQDFPATTRDLAAMLDRAMQQMRSVFDGGLRTPEMVELLKEWDS